MLSRARLAQPVSDSFQPPPIAESQLRELRELIARCAVDRLIEEMKRPGALDGESQGPDEKQHDHAESTKAKASL